MDYEEMQDIINAFSIVTQSIGGTLTFRMESTQTGIYYAKFVDTDKNIVVGGASDENPAKAIYKAFLKWKLPNA